MKIFQLANARAGDAVTLIDEHLTNLARVASEKPSVHPKLAADPRTNSIVFSGTDAQAQIVEALVLRLDAEPAAESSEAGSPAESSPKEKPSPTSETITVVRATYELPQKVAEALHEFIQQNGQYFDFLASNGPTPMIPAEQLMDEDEDVGGLNRAGFGNGLRGAFPAGLAGITGLGNRTGIFAGFHARLTIIATPEIQAQFGHFIKAMGQKPEEPMANGDATVQLTLVRVRYELRLTPPASSGSRNLNDAETFLQGLEKAEGKRAKSEVLRKYVEDQHRASATGFGQLNVAGRGIGMAGAKIGGRFSGPSGDGDASDSLGDGVLNLLTAVKESNLVPLLLVSADAEGLTVTTTEEFQQALGKFIRFLQEQEPQETVQIWDATTGEPLLARLRQGGWGRPSGAPSAGGSLPLDPSHPAAALKENRMEEASKVEGGRLRGKNSEMPHLLLHAARELLKEDKLAEARTVVQKAQALDFNYELFDDRPDLVLRDIEIREAFNAARDTQKPVYSGPVIPIDGKTELGAAQLAMTRYREAEISAKLLALQEMLKRGTVNKPAMLLAIGREEANNRVWTMLRELLPLEAQRRNLSRTHGDKHPEVVALQQKIDVVRQALGFADDGIIGPVDLFDLYIKSLEHQLETTREVIKALEESGKQSSTGAGARKRLDAQIRELRAQISLHKGILQAMEKAQQDGSAQHVLTYLDSKEFREQLEALANGALELVERSIITSKRLYELLAEQQKLVKRLHASDPRIKDLNRQVAQELDALGITGYRNAEPQDYLRFLHDEAAKRLLESMQKLNALEREPAEVSETPSESEIPPEFRAPQAN
ncbi:MAG: secretin N-terminal domain-containing protein [Planctomycetaceae bacterium]